MQFAVTTALGSTTQFNAFSIERLGTGFNVNPTSTTAPIQFSGVTHFSDNVGIGTASPDVKLQVGGTAETTPQYIRIRGERINAAGDICGIQMYNSALSGGRGNSRITNSRGVNNYGSDLEFWTNPDSDTTATEKMRITSTGNVGIGTASPLQRLHVNGNGQNPVIYMTDPTNNRYASGMGTHNVTNVGQRLDFYNGDSGANGTSLSSSHIRMSIDASGNVGIGTVSPRSGHILHVSKNVSTSGYYNIARIGGDTSSYNTLVFGSKEGRPHIGGHRGDYGLWLSLIHI